MTEDLIPVEVVGLSTSPASGNAFILILGEISGPRKLPVIIGENEATAIVIGLEQKTPPRPMAHDLLCNLMEYVGMEVTEVLIDGLDEGTFLSKIRFSMNGEQGVLDARPSDAVAIAVRLNVEILVSESILDEAGIPSSDIELSSQAEGNEVVSPVEQLENELAHAIEIENYEEAARLRDRLAKLKK